jgi:hypothetical protein
VLGKAFLMEITAAGLFGTFTRFPFSGTRSERGASNKTAAKVRRLKYVSAKSHHFLMIYFVTDL